MNQEDIKILNNLKSNNEIENVIKNLPRNKSPGPYGFTAEFYKKFTEDLMTLVFKLFNEIEREVELSHSLLEANINLKMKLEKYPMKKRTASQAP